MAQNRTFSTSVGGTKIFGVSGDLSEYRGSGITFLGITSLTTPLLPWPIDDANMFIWSTVNHSDPEPKKLGLNWC